MNAVATTPAEQMLLQLHGFGAGFGNRVVLADVDLDVKPLGLLALMGPTGSGKSTLLRIVCGVAQQNANLKTWGDAQFLGRPLGDAEWPGLVSQDARMLIATVLENLVSGLKRRSRLTMAQQRERVAEHLELVECAHLSAVFTTPAIQLDTVDQRLLSIIRQTIAEPVLLCVDEPTSGLNDEDAMQVLKLLGNWSRSHAVLMASHHQRQAREHAEQVALLASGRIQEATTAKSFFGSPQSEAGREFVNRGTCASPRPDALPEELDEDMSKPPPLPEPARRAMSAWAGPRGFVWLERGRLAGTPQPGVFDELSADIDALVRVGVSRMLTLLEQPLACSEQLAKRGILTLHVLVADMAAPSVEQATLFCRQIDQWLDSGQTVAVHCRAGHGRTGTALAAYRIWKGAAAVEAVEGVRRLESRWIQSKAQVDFLIKFARFMRSS